MFGDQNDKIDEFGGEKFVMQGSREMARLERDGGQTKPRMFVCHPTRQKVYILAIQYGHYTQKVFKCCFVCFSPPKSTVAGVHKLFAGPRSREN
jgi:hypothetical protein